MDILQVVYYLCDFVCKSDSLVSAVKSFVQTIVK